METFPELHTERLTLRGMDSTDADGYAELLSDPGTHPFITESGPVPVREIPDRIRRNRHAFQARSHLYWSIEWSGEFVGYVALHDAWSPRPVLSYAIRPAWRRRGVAAEALRAVCRHAFAVLEVRHLIARTHERNVPSAQLLLGLGFRESASVVTPQGPRREFELSAR